MPYIDQSFRDKFDPHIDALSQNDNLYDAGFLNYIITRLTHEFLCTRGFNYEGYNAAIGVLESAKLELYRRRVAPYEEVKITENGDI